jgi:UDP-glucose 4-epimerase
MGGRHVLVTGGAGFIGAHVVRALLASGADVTVADVRQPAGHGGQPGAGTAAGDGGQPGAGVDWVVGDLTDPGVVDAAVQPGTDAIVHLAAVTSVLGSLERPVETFEINVAATAALIERARTVGTACLVLASTNAAVGSGGEGRIDERTPLRPLTPYGATKAAAEMLLSAATAAYGVRGVALRLTNVYGTGMLLKDSVVARIMRAAVTGATFDVYGDGNQRRDYIYADDVVAAVMLALGGDMSGPVIIGSGTSTSVLELLDLARAATGTALPVRHVPARSGEMAGVTVDIARARSVGWSPTVGLAEGLARVWAAWE